MTWPRAALRTSHRLVHGDESGGRCHRCSRPPVAAGAGDGGADRQAVRERRAVPAGPGDRRTPTRVAAHHSVHRCAAPDFAADRDDADPIPGDHHPRQRQCRRLRGGLLQGRRRGEVGRGDRERLLRDRSDRPNDTAQGRRTAHPGRDALGDRQDQPRHPRDPRRHHHRMGCAGHPGRAQRHPTARQHEAGDGPPGGGRTGEAGENHCRRR